MRRQPTRVSARQGTFGASPAAVWLLAVRPKTLPAAAAPVLIGSGLAALRGVFSPLPALAALAGAVSIQVATNLANDYFDFVRGADTADRVGPVRVTQSGLIPPQRVLRATSVALGGAAVVGGYLVWVGGVPILVIGLFSLACAVGYSAGPFPLAYHGLGDVFVFVFFGLVAVAGTYYVQALTFTSESLLAGAGVGALSTAVLVVNNLRDVGTDARAGKRTLAVRLGVGWTRAQYVLLLSLAASAPPLGVLLYDWPLPVLGASLAVALGTIPARRVLSFREAHELLPALGQTARVLALYGLLLATALALGARV